MTNLKINYTVSWVCKYKTFSKCVL